MKKKTWRSVLIITIFIALFIYLLSYDTVSSFTAPARIIIAFLVMITLFIPMVFHALQRLEIYNLKKALQDEHANNASIAMFSTVFTLIISVMVITTVYNITQGSNSVINYNEIGSTITTLLLILLINYYGTGSRNTKEKVDNFNLAIRNFITQNFILNTLAIILVIMFMKDNNIIIGIVTAYMFYTLERINNNYIEKSKKLPKSTPPEILNQIFLNIMIIFILNNYIQIYNAIEQGIEMPININIQSLSIHYILFIVAIALSYYVTPRINVLYNKSKKKYLEVMKS